VLLRGAAFFCSGVFRGGATDGAEGMWMAGARATVHYSNATV
jgi:hypothetical protein